MTVHESSLSPCIHSILANKIGYVDKAYELYLRTSRLDLDNYNNDTKDGLHITSMAGTWMSIVYGFAGMNVKNDKLCFEPRIPKVWEKYSFNISFREKILNVSITKNSMLLILKVGDNLSIKVDGVDYILKNKKVTIIPIRRGGC